jgi:rubrerythrin
LLNTVSTFITFHGKLEEISKTFYEKLAKVGKSSHTSDVFKLLAKENQRHKETVQRTYREVITDAFEGGFPLLILNEKDYEINTDIPDNTEDAIAIGIMVEKTILRFCTDAAKATSGLMADIPQAFEWVASRKTRRINKLKTISSF